MNRVVVEETLRRHVTNGGYLTMLALLAIVGLAASQFAQPAAMWPTLTALLAIVAGSGPIGPEFSSGTLQLILVKPIGRATYLLSRAAGVVLAVWLAALVACACEVIARLLSGGVPWGIFGTMLLNIGADTILTVSLLTLLGSLTRAWFNVAIYMGVQIGLSMAVGILTMARRFPAVAEAMATAERTLYPELPRIIDGAWLALVLSVAAAALLLACLAFRRREVPYGAD